MDDPKYLVTSLLDAGMSQAEIVDALRKAGIEVTQPTISRIKNGAATSFDIGIGLLRLHQSRRVPRRAAAS